MQAQQLHELVDDAGHLAAAAARIIMKISWPGGGVQ
jgi:hypothetical protein